MTAVIDQYKLLFILSWILLYFIFPAWISLHETITSRGLTDSLPLARALVIFGFTIYFSLSSYLMSRYVNALAVSEPVVLRVSDWSKHFRNNAWLVIMCSLAVVLHLPALPIVEIGYLHQGLWMYDFTSRLWQEIFGFPIQYFFWTTVLIMVFIVKQKKCMLYMSDRAPAIFTVFKEHNGVKLFSMIVMFVVFSIYAYFFPYYDRIEALQLLRFPPVSKFFYLMTYYAVGINQAGPKVIQLMFYLLGAVYLYRTVFLFRKKETAILGATIYLFSPIIFSYASLTFLASGTVFFMILISYYFLRFMKYEGSRDLLLTAYFIGMGFMYKRVMLVMFIICFAYLVLSRLKNRDLKPLVHFKVLLLSLIPVLPWMKIGVLDVYESDWAALISFDSLTAYLRAIPSQVSLIVFLLLLFSFLYAFATKRDALTRYFGLYFVVYYFFFSLKDAGVIYHRYAMSFYPAIAVFLAQGIFSITEKIRWKHAFKVVFTILAVYLIALSITPRDRTDLVSYKYNDFESQMYPIDKATDWIKDATANDEKILSLFMTNYKFYVERMYPDRNLIAQDKILYSSIGMTQELVYPLENLKKYCHEKGISYIMFPHGPRNTFTFGAGLKESTYLKENLDADNAFAEVARFNLDDNYIIIYKLNENAGINE